MFWISNDSLPRLSLGYHGDWHELDMFTNSSLKVDLNAVDETRKSVTTNTASGTTIYTKTHDTVGRLNDESHTCTCTWERPLTLESVVAIKSKTNEWRPFFFFKQSVGSYLM